MKDFLSQNIYLQNSIYASMIFNFNCIVSVAAAFRQYKDCPAPQSKELKNLPSSRRSSRVDIKATIFASKLDQLQFSVVPVYRTLFLAPLAKTCDAIQRKNLSKRNYDYNY